EFNLVVEPHSVKFYRFFFAVRIVNRLIRLHCVAAANVPQYRSAPDIIIMLSRFVRAFIDDMNHYKNTIKKNFKNQVKRKNWHETCIKENAMINYNYNRNIKESLKLIVPGYEIKDI